MPTQLPDRTSRCRPLEDRAFVSRSPSANCVAAAHKGRSRAADEDQTARPRQETIGNLERALNAVAGLVAVHQSVEGRQKAASAFPESRANRVKPEMNESVRQVAQDDPRVRAKFENGH
jgi:murein tripeptide amidase MpaA